MLGFTRDTISLSCQGFRRSLCLLRFERPFSRWFYGRGEWMGKSPWSCMQFSRSWTESRSFAAFPISPMSFFPRPLLDEIISREPRSWRDFYDRLSTSLQWWQFSLLSWLNFWVFSCNQETERGPIFGDRREIIRGKMVVKTPSPGFSFRRVSIPRFSSCNFPLVETMFSTWKKVEKWAISDCPKFGQAYEKKPEIFQIFFSKLWILASMRRVSGNNQFD